MKKKFYALLLSLILVVGITAQAAAENANCKCAPEETCTNCTSGKVPANCQTCEGTGKVNCGTCNGTGRADCTDTNCDGNSCDCSTNNCDCSGCGGKCTGKMDCDASGCTSGKVICTATGCSGGKVQVDCTVCGGDGVIDAVTCEHCESNSTPGEDCDCDTTCTTCVAPPATPSTPSSSGGSGSSSGGGSSEPASASVPASVASAASGATVSASGLASAPVSVEQLRSYTDLVANNTNNFNTTYGIPANAKIAALFNLNLKKGQTIPEGGMIVPIKVKGSQAGDYVIVLHRKADGIWEIVGRGFLGDNLTINTTFTSFSPVMVLKVDAADVATSGIRAPKTGE